MPRRYPTVLILLAGLVLYGAEAYAASKTRQPKMPTEQQFLQGQIHTLRPQRATKDLPVNIEGRTLVHDAKTDTYTITGAARVEQGPTTITADQIVLQHRYQGVAVGHVHIIDPTSDIHSTQAWFDLHNETARLADALDKSLDEPAVGETLAKLGGSVPAKAERNPAAFDRFVRSEIARWAPILTAVKTEK